MEHQDNTFLMLVKIYYDQKFRLRNQYVFPIDILFTWIFVSWQVFLYRFDSNKEKNDIFNDVKKLAVQLSEKYKADGSRIAWVEKTLFW